MLDTFEAAFRRDATLSVGAGGEMVTSPVDDAVIGRLGGGSFEQGLYRIVQAAEVRVWNDRVASAFPEFAHRTTCFGYDWLGRVFAVDRDRLEDGEPGVVMFEPGTGEALEIPCGIVAFHNEELIDYRDAALASDFHDRWLASGGAAPRRDQCVGYRKPLFLGGADEIHNLELSDIDVYWHLAGQLIAKTRGLAPGTPVHITRG